MCCGIYFCQKLSLAKFLSYKNVLRLHLWWFLNFGNFASSQVGGSLDFSKLWKFFAFAKNFDFRYSKPKQVSGKYLDIAKKKFLHDRRKASNRRIIPTHRLFLWLLLRSVLFVKNVKFPTFGKLPHLFFPKDAPPNRGNCYTVTLGKWNQNCQVPTI